HLRRRHRPGRARRRPAEPDAGHHPARGGLAAGADVLRRAPGPPGQHRRADLRRVRGRGPRDRAAHRPSRDRRRRHLLHRTHRTDRPAAAGPELEAHSMETAPTSRRLSRRRASAALGALAATTLALTACGGGSLAGEDADQGAEDRAFRLGLVAPTTGVASLEGNSLVAGATLAVEAVNAAGGVLGHPIELTVADDKSDAATSTQVTQQLIRQNDVDYVLGTIAGDTSVAAGSVAAEAGVPFSTVVNGTVEFCSPHFWPFGASERMMVEDVIPLMIEEYGPRVGLVGNDYIFPHTYHSVATEIIAENGGEV